ncbi:MAG: Single-stranded endonuclease [Bradyrhizobium sp.]|nr:Single-stranded endonuclease [Bradyrhizobium sp.]
MILLTPDLRFALRANDIAHRAAQAAEKAEPDPVPVVKFFNPVGAATWLATELDADGDTLFGLADLGFGCPELGSFSLRELASIRLPFGMGIERDLGFSGRHRLSTWADWSRRAGSILLAEALLRRAATQSDRSELPPDPDPDGTGADG